MIRNMNGVTKGIFKIVSRNIKITTFHSIFVTFSKVYIFRVRVINFRLPVTISKIALMMPLIFLWHVLQFIHWYFCKLLKMTLNEKFQSVNIAVGGVQIFFAFWRLITFYFASMCKMESVMSYPVLLTFDKFVNWKKISPPQFNADHRDIMSRNDA